MHYPLQSCLVFNILMVFCFIVYRNPSSGIIDLLIQSFPGIKAGGELWRYHSVASIRYSVDLSVSRDDCIAGAFGSIPSPMLLHQARELSWVHLYVVCTSKLNWEGAKQKTGELCITYGENEFDCSRELPSEMGLTFILSEFISQHFVQVSIVNNCRMVMMRNAFIVPLDQSQEREICGCYAAGR